MVPKIERLQPERMSSQQNIRRFRRVRRRLQFDRFFMQCIKDGTQAFGAAHRRQILVVIRAETLARAGSVPLTGAKGAYPTIGLT